MQQSRLIGRISQFVRSILAGKQSFEIEAESDRHGLARQHANVATIRIFDYLTVFIHKFIQQIQFLLHHLILSQFYVNSKVIQSDFGDMNEMFDLFERSVNTPSLSTPSVDTPSPPTGASQQTVKLGELL